MSYTNPLFWWLLAITAWIVFGIGYAWVLSRAAGRDEPKPWPARPPVRHAEGEPVFRGRRLTNLLETKAEDER